MKEAADLLGISISGLVDNLMRMKDYGYQVDFDFDEQTIDALETERDTMAARAASGDNYAAERLKELNAQLDKLKAQKN
jgi:hypothetical protein